MTTEKETKEITKESERWCRITKEGCEVVVSSPRESDSLEDIVKMADKLATKHGKKDTVFGYR